MLGKREPGSREVALERLGQLESEVLKRVWARGEISVRELHTELESRLAYTTLMTTLDRLYKKTILKRRKEGRAFLYSPAVTEGEYREMLAQRLMGVIMGSPKHQDAVLCFFVNALGENDAETLDKLDQMVHAKMRTLRGE